MAHQGHQSGEWETSLCQRSCNCCCVGTFLPCILIGRASDRLRNPSQPDPDSMNSDCLISGALIPTGFTWLYTMFKRTEMRERLGIKGSGFGDCCAAFWCHCCAVAQQDQEAKLRLQQSGPIKDQYQPQQGGMVMEPPPPRY
ncbi:hypothetical protein M426DRAFT_324399 [Hypoxylon sp. CI-4A]|nr:hypothetical protein M426DRAFT_324399 [Hypoxylon sp. CI-4A]